MAVKTETKPVNTTPLEAKVAAGVADAMPDVDTEEADDSKELDLKAQLFVRQVTDNVVKAIADLVKPAPATAPEPVIETVIEPKAKKKQKSRSIIDMLLGG
jgi:hypothetical protein